MPASISFHGQSTLPDGRVLISGGYDGSVYYNNCYIYEPSNNTWGDVASLPSNLWIHGQSILLDGRVMVSGGSSTANETNAVNAVYIYIPNEDAWATASPMPNGSNWHGQSTLLDGRVLVSGGRNSSGLLNTAYLYNSSTDGWENASPMPARIGGLGQTTLLNGDVLISGGYIVGNNVYIYTPSSTGLGSWRCMASLPVIRSIWGHGQSTLADGKVLISGGWNNSINTNEVYIYTSSNDAWPSAKSLDVGIRWHNQSTLADGRVLISGGYNGGVLNTAYIYTPAGWVAVSSAQQLIQMP